MKKHLLVIAALLASGQMATFAQSSSPSTRPPAAQQTPTPGTTPPAPQQQRPSARPATLDLSDYGVQIAPEARLIVMMAALDAAGFDPTPAGREPSEFRALVRRDQASLDADLRARMRRFYELNKLKIPATPAEQAARYVSLAYALGPAPAFEAPARTGDLFGGALDVLDFAPLVREFYTKSGIAERLPAYLAAHQKEGDRLRPQTSEMVRAVLTYLHTRPATVSFERVPVKNPAAKPKKDAPPAFITRERERRFVLVPDLLAVPGSINFRVIGDDYFAVVHTAIDPASSDVRRAYLQYVVDPIILRFNREVALKRSEIRDLLNAASATPGATVTTDAGAPDVFQAIGRSLVIAADARMNFNARLRLLTEQTSARLQRAKEPERAAIIKESQADRAALEDALTAQLADAYERGAVLAFYFSEQLRDQEIAEFDFANFFADMISRLDVAREKLRPAEYAAARERIAQLRRQVSHAAANRTSSETREDERLAALDRSLAEINELLRQRKYTEAEPRLRALMSEYAREPRIFFALAQAASISATDAFDDATRDERLGRALANYRFAINSATEESDRPLISRAYTAMGRILAFLERKDEAAKAFEAALSLGDVKDGAYRDAAAELKQLRP